MQTLNQLESTNKRLLVTAVSRNGEARDLSEIRKVLIKSFVYICEGLVLVHRHFLKPRNVGGNHWPTKRRKTKFEH